LQKRAVDYTATTGTSITGLNALAAGDVVTVWTVNAFSVTNAISNTLVDAKGDLIVATAADTPARLAVGSANQVLTVDSSTATGLKWATPASGGKVLQVVSSTATAWQGIKTASATDVTGMSISITPSATTSRVLVFGMLNGVQSQSTTVREEMQLSLVDGSNTQLYRIVEMHTFLDGSFEMGTVPFNYLHSPSTTSAITYKLRVMNNTATTGIYVNNYNSANAITSSIIAMEIGA